MTTAPLLARIGDFAGMLAGAQDDAAIQALLASRTTGRTVGAAEWTRPWRPRPTAASPRQTRPQAQDAAGRRGWRAISYSVTVIQK